MTHSFKETCSILGIGRTTLFRLCDEKQIGYIQERPGCKKLFTDAQIEAYLARNEHKARRVL